MRRNCAEPTRWFASDFAASGLNSKSYSYTSKLRGKPALLASASKTLALARAVF